MAKINCFAFLLGGKTTRSKGRSRVDCAKKVNNGNDCPKVKPVEFMGTADAIDVSKSGGGDAPSCGTNVSVYASARRARGVDEDTASTPTKRYSSDAAGDDSSGGNSNGDNNNSKNAVTADPDAGESSSVGRRTSPTAASLPELKRSCSNIETARSVRAEEFDVLVNKSRSYGDLKGALPSGRLTTTPSGAPDASPTTASVRTSWSADRVMLKKRSSRQVLPSRSRKLWWRLLLWSHRNLHRRGASFTMPAGLPPSADTYGGASHQKDGYTSDTLDAATSTTREPKNKGVAVKEEPTTVPSHHRWGAFSSETTSSLDRVSAWVNSLGSVSFHVVDEDEDAVTADHTEHDSSGVNHRAWCSDEIVECSTAAEKKPTARAKRRVAEEAFQASSTMAQTLSTLSSAAHISGMGLHSVPMIAAFSSLRAVDLSGNFIVHIHPGSLPKGLHSLDLSRNKIASIQGLRELTRLRVLNLSYNRISRIGHGLSSCTAIRELYLAGNKISDVEGLHRLLKLAVLDVSFNRISTAKSLGQLVANYGSLRALDLAGNPVQANFGDDTLRRAVSGLLPRLEYLNKQQAVKPAQRATLREVAKDSVAQAALGNSTSGWGARRRQTSRRVSVSQSPGGSSAAKSRGRRSRSKTRGQQGSSSLSRR